MALMPRHIAARRVCDPFDVQSYARGPRVSKLRTTRQPTCCAAPQPHATAPADRAPSTSAPSPVKDPFAERVVYNDSWLDLLFISIFTSKMAAQLEGVSPVAPGAQKSTWDDFVRVSKSIMSGRNSVEQREVVANVLASLFPAGAPAVFRRLFPPTKLSAELNALFASIGFSWLVGKMELREADIQISPTEVRRQRSVVHIEKCRYLEDSGCVGMCTNMCKMPTQKFFCEEFGLPLTMTPNFEDLSCDMIFGQPPPALENDPLFRQPCFPRSCTIGSPDKVFACPKLDTGASRRAAMSVTPPVMGIKKA